MSSPDAGATPATTEAAPDGIADPRLRALLLFIERLTGHRVRTLRLQELRGDPERGRAAIDAQRASGNAQPAGTGSQVSQPAGWGVAIDQVATHQEHEVTRFTATGSVVTADGTELRFEFQAVMERSEMERSETHVRLGDAVRPVDPLMLSLDGSPVTLGPDQVSFDLDSDGTAEQIAFAGAGSGLLAVDANANGAVDDGRELFGPASGDGFAQLAAFDADANGWIDEGDPVYGSLRLWARNADGSEALIALPDAGVGAIYLGRVATPFELRAPDQATLGQVRSSGVYLAEDGTARPIQQVDLVA
jgi:hypothetical protein